MRNFIGTDEAFALSVVLILNNFRWEIKMAFVALWRNLTA
jgi:hypothetical protein